MKQLVYVNMNMHVQTNGHHFNVKVYILMICTHSATIVVWEKWAQLSSDCLIVPFTCRTWCVYCVDNYIKHSFAFRHGSPMNLRRIHQTATVHNISSNILVRLMKVLILLNRETIQCGRVFWTPWINTELNVHFYKWFIWVVLNRRNAYKVL